MISQADFESDRVMDEWEVNLRIANLPIFNGRSKQMENGLYKRKTCKEILYVEDGFARSRMTAVYILRLSKLKRSQIFEWVHRGTLDNWDKRFDGSLVYQFFFYFRKGKKSE